MKKKKWLKGKAIIVVVVVITVAAVAIVSCSKTKSGGDVEFTKLAEDQIPSQILEKILPEYNKLERALACIVDDKIYIVATRGEKPTSGYGVEVEYIKVAENEGITKISVYTKFSDPTPEEALSQALTYPFTVVETNLDMLPDEIELKVKY